MSGTPADVDLFVHAPVDEVRRRMASGLVGVGSLWFTSQAELRRWDRATEPLFVQWTGPLAFDVGPRLASLSAARFSPVLRGALVAEGGGTRVRGVVAPPRFAAGLLAAWAAALALWLVLGTRATLAGEEPPGWFALWVVLALALVAAGGIGWVGGGRALRDQLPALSRVVGDADAGADDWA